VDDPRVQLLLGIGPAVDRYDFPSLKQSEKPKFLIHGEFDELIPVRDVKKFYAQLREPKDLVIIEAADHLFNGKTMELGQAVEELLGDYDEQVMSDEAAAKDTKV
jgi:alpha/beta superfamily hydrolase